MQQTATAPPGQGRRFYAIRDNADGTVDVYLNPPWHRAVRIVRGVVPWDGIEDDIRARYDDWLSCATVVWV